jgi:thiamine biosynthesis protein ThiS
VITLQINGKHVELERPTPLLAYLEQLGVNPKAVAVEHNGTILERAAYGGVTLKQDDTVEIVRMVGGGLLGQPGIGQWVVSDDSAGVWRVFRVERDFYEFRYRLTNPKLKQRTLVFGTRLLNGVWKRSFSTDVWSAGLVHPLDPEKSNRLAAALASDPDLLANFNRYSPKPIDLICNLGFTAVPGGFGEFQRTLAALLGDRIGAGLPLDEILGLIAASSLKDHQNRNPATLTLQLSSPDHLRRGDEFVFTTFRALSR